MASFSLSKQKQGKFGLIKAGGRNRPVSSSFRDELEEEDTTPAPDIVEKPKQKLEFSGGETILGKQIQNDALDQDSTVYQYDEVYDVMKEAEHSARLGFSSTSKQPRYINSMLKQASVRAVEDVKVMSRRLQRETEASLEEDGIDKDQLQVFVTDNWKAQLEEQRKHAEEQEQLSKKGNDDRDYVGFHRNLLNMRTSTSAARTVFDPVLAASVEAPIVAEKKKFDEHAPELKGGLNVMVDKKALALEEKRRRDRKREEEMRIQFEQAREKKKLEEEQKLEALKDTLKRKIDDDAVSEAKRRFEERKRLKQNK